ncbi:50S ribosomal protein L25 [Candidatus Neomarinimicrobiota bacterium]
MAKTDNNIEVFRREEIGKKDLKQLRTEGFIPGIYYAHDQAQAIPFKVAQKDFHTALQEDALIYQISVADNRRNVLIKEIQYHPVTEEILHVDFHGVRMDEEVQVRVPVQTLGHPVGVKDEGGQIHQALLEVEIKCRASDIPSHFEIVIDDLHMGESIHVGDLDIGNAELITAADTMVVSVSRARGMTIDEPVVAEVEEDEDFLFEEEGEEKAEEGEGPAEKEQSPEK